VRLFVAVNLPTAERERVLAATAALRASPLPVRWLHADAYHLTLKFLGEVPEERLGAINAALLPAADGAARFAVELGGAGVFPNPHRPSVWWIGIGPSRPLAELQAAVEAGLAPLGYPTEARAFSPHLTIGRTRRGAPASAFRAAESWLQNVAYQSTIIVETVDLMRSHLTSHGARYECLRAIALQP